MARGQRWQMDPREPRTIDGRAPMADTSANVGAPMSALSWANTFRNRETGQTNSPWAANVLRNTDTSGMTDAQKGQIATLTGPATKAAPTTIAQSVLDEIIPRLASAATSGAVGGPLSFSFGAAAPKTPAPPSLTVLANGGMNSAQRWTSAADEGMRRVAKYADPNRPIRTTYGLPEKREDMGWASAFGRK